MTRAPWQPRPRLWSRSDLIAAVIVFVAAFAVGRLAVDRFTSAGNPAQSYQGEFGPAALLACGHGFVNPPRAEPASGGFQTLPPGFEALSTFLAQKRDSFECSELPARFAGEPPNLFQGTHRYLMMLATAVWKVTGVSWSALSILSALLSAITATAVYLLARPIMGRVLAIAITAIWITSPLQLEQLPHLRDYAKAPFFMFILCAVAWIALTRASRRRTIAALAITGAVIGFGFGFRTDVVAYLPFVLLSVLAFRPGLDRSDLITRGLAAAAAVAAFTVAAAPILSAYQSADNTAHVAMLGLSDPSRDWLSLQEAPYSFFYRYDDRYLETVIGGYSERHENLRGLLTIGNSEYTKWSNEYYRSLIMTFPGDMLVRAWAAVLAVLQLPFHPVYVLRPAWVAPSLDGIFQYRATVLSWLAYLSPFVAAIILAVGTSVVSMRLFGVLALFGVIVPGMTSIQFQGRHVFHLEVLSLLTYGCLLHFLWTVFRRQEKPRPSLIGIAPRAIVVAVGLAAVIVVPVVAARAYQEQNVTKLFSAYESAEMERIDAAPVPRPDGQLLLPVPLNTSGPPHFIDTNVLVITVGGEACDADALSLRLRYRAVPPFVDLTQETIVPVPPPGESRSRLLFPAYTIGARSKGRESPRFEGVEVAAGDAACIQSLARFKDPDRYPLLLESLLLPDWRQHPLYEALRELEPRSADWRTENQTIPAGLRPGRHWLSQIAAENSRTTYRSPQVQTIDARTIEILGKAESSSAYILSWPYESRPKGSVFFVEGELFEGGLSVGLQQKEQWAQLVNVFRPGRFRTALQVEESGEFGAVLANNMQGGRQARIHINRYGWLPPVSSSQ